MKINISNSYTPPSHNTIANQESLAAHRGSTAGKGSVSLVRADSVTISGAATLIDNSTRANNLDPTFDTKRVAELKNEIHAGDYVIDPEIIAAKFYQLTMRLQ